jgi:hypothetical protein
VIASAAYVAYFAAVGAASPYLAVYYRSLGFRGLPEQAAVE